MRNTNTDTRRNPLTIVPRVRVAEHTDSDDGDPMRWWLKNTTMQEAITMYDPFQVGGAL